MVIDSTCAEGLVHDFEPCLIVDGCGGMRAKRSMSKINNLIFYGEKMIPMGENGEGSCGLWHQTAKYSRLFSFFSFFPAGTRRLKLNMRGRTKAEGTVVMCQAASIKIK